MIVISDTTPIISLMKTNRLNLLKEMFSIVYIPNAVYMELIENKNYSKEAELIKDCDFIKVIKIENEKSASILMNFTGLDAGESEAIILADEQQSDVLLMDEHKGRQVAKKMGIVITGTIGILAQAFDEKILSKEDIKECIDLLKKNYIRISEKLYQKLQNYVGI